MFLKINHLINLVNLIRLRGLLQLKQIDLNERGSSGSYDLHNDCL